MASRNQSQARGELFASLFRDQYGYPVERTVIAALAAVLLSVARSDAQFSPVEARSILRLMQRSFGLSRDDAIRLVRIGDYLEKEHQALPDALSRLNEHYDERQRRFIFVLCWLVAHADERIDIRESELLSVIGTQLGLPPAEKKECQISALLLWEQTQADLEGSTEEVLSLAEGE